MLSRQNTNNLFRTLPAHVTTHAATDLANTAAKNEVKESGNNNVQKHQQPEKETKQAEPVHNLEDFDLLAGHDFGNTQDMGKHGTDHEIQKVLVWQKLQTTGYHPAAREVSLNSTSRR